LIDGLKYFVKFYSSSNNSEEILVSIQTWLAFWTGFIKPVLFF